MAKIPCQGAIVSARRMRGEDCRQAKNFKKSFSSSFLFFGHVSFLCIALSLRNLYLYLVFLSGRFILLRLHLSNHDHVQNAIFDLEVKPCHFHQQIVNWSDGCGTPAMTRTLRKKKKIRISIHQIFIFSKFFPTDTFHSWHKTKKNVERKSIYVTWQVSELLPPPFLILLKNFFLLWAR